MTKRANGEGTVRRRSDGRWEARLEYLDETTGKSRRQSFYARTSKEARYKLKAALKRLDEGQPVRDASATLGDVCRVWRTTTLVASSRKDTTKALYAGLLKSHVETSPVAFKPLNRLRSSDVNALVIELRGKTKSNGERQLSEATVEKIIRVLRLVLDGAMRDELLARNPVDASERVSAPRKDAHYLAAAEVLTILKAASHTRYAADPVAHRHNGTPQGRSPGAPMGRRRPRARGTPSPQDPLASGRQASPH